MIGVKSALDSLQYEFSAVTRASAAGSGIVPLFLAVFVLFLATLRLERSGREIKIMAHAKTLRRKGLKNKQNAFLGVLCVFSAAGVRMKSSTEE